MSGIMSVELEKINRETLLHITTRLAESVESACREGAVAHEMERRLFKSLLEVGRLLLEEFFRLNGTGDEGEHREMPEGKMLKRMPEAHVKQYLSVFGEIQVKRTVYAVRQGQKIECVPLDARLELPEGKYSYLLQEWSQSLSVDEPYAHVSKILERILGLQAGVHALERMNTGMAESAAGFWETRAEAPVAQGDEMVVLTADGKGVPIRSPEGGKKMSVVGSVYTVAPCQRTPEEVLQSLFAERGERPRYAAPRPEPTARYVRASLKRDEEESMPPSFEEIFTWLADEAAQRDPDNTQKRVVVMDGQDALWKSAASHFNAETVEILDLLHATGYVRKAAALFYDKPAVQEAFFRFVCGYLLNGDVATVVNIFHFWAEDHLTSASDLREIKRIQGYFHNNAARMRYADYLAAGYPIASGVIEGACRYVVKDRLERTGMRWSMPGARSMLNLRCIFLNGEWDAFTSFHIQQENQRLYWWKAANDAQASTVSNKAAA